MPAKGESTYPSDWLQIAADDFKRVPRRLNEDDTADAAFHLQQALEKYLKGFLLSRGWRLERIHDLRALLEEAARYEPSLKKFRRLCAEVTAYYIQERYPFFGTKPGREEVKANFEQARELVKLVEKLADTDY
ncbi:MAG: HEPN domain-containing protein [Anaerolineae bacterium]